MYFCDFFSAEFSFANLFLVDWVDTFLFLHLFLCLASFFWGGEGYVLFILVPLIHLWAGANLTLTWGKKNCWYSFLWISFLRGAWTWKPFFFVLCLFHFA